MGIRVYKPTTNGRRNMTSLDFAEITTSTPEKSLLVALKNKAGRKRIRSSPGRRLGRRTASRRSWGNWAFRSSTAATAGRQAA